MLKRDFVLRMIERTAAAIAKALGLVEAGRSDEAADVLAAAYDAILRVDRDMLETLDAASLSPLLGPAEVVRVIARLLEAESLLHAANQEPKRARRLARRASELYLVVGLGDDPEDRACFVRLYEQTKRLAAEQSPS